jgi:hypothetical protein
VGIFTSEGTENEMRWDRSSAPFMEAWYITLGHRASGTGLWFRYTLSAPDPRYGDPYCELWAFLFDPSGSRTFAGKERLPISELGGSGFRDEAVVRVGRAWLAEGHLEGRVEQEGRSLEWSLEFEPASRCFHHLPVKIRSRIEKRLSVVSSPNLGVPFSGRVEIDGDVLELQGERGQQGHRWGRSHSSTWAWGHCSMFDHGQSAVFEGVSAKAALGPVPGPTSTFVYLQLDGEDLVFNELGSALKARSRYEMPTWAFTAANDSWKLVGASRVNPARLVQVTYADPDSTLRFCANSEIADLALEVYRREGSAWTHHRSLTATGTAHLEFGRKDLFKELPLAL